MGLEANSEKKNIEDILALSAMQEGMLFHYLKNRNSEEYFVQQSLNLSGKVNFELFCKAWEQVIFDNPMLRTVFAWRQVSKPVQIVLKKQKLDIKNLDFSCLQSELEKEEMLFQIIQEERKEKFDLEKGPLFRINLCKLNEGNYQMIISNHHIIIDGWSSGIIIKEFFQNYKKLVSGQILLPGNKTSFKEYLRWLTTESLEPEKKYWEKYLHGFETLTTLPFDQNSISKKLEMGRFDYHFPNNLLSIMEKFIRTNKITYGALFYTVWGIILHKFSNFDDVLFGTTVSGRSAELKGIEDMVGLFINTLPLRIIFDGRIQFNELLTKVNADIAERERFATTPLVDIKGYSGLASKDNLFDSLVVIENYPFDRSLRQGGILKLNSFSTFERTNYPLVLGITMFDGITLSVNYEAGRFDEEDISRVINYFLNILKAVLDNPLKRVVELDMLSDIERRILVNEFNDTEVLYPDTMLIHELFEEQVKKTPRNLALLMGEEMMTYEELNKRADEFAGIVTESGVKKGQLVALIITRSFEMIICILGIWKAGGAYLPIDPEYPEERIRYMINDSGVKTLVLQEKLKSIVPSYDISYQCSDKLLICKLNDNHPQTLPEDLAYVIYTSGSTGYPKGVMIRHRSIINTIFWRKHEFGLTKDDRALQLFSFSFDGFVVSFLTPLVSGATLVLLNEEEVKDLVKIKEVLVKDKITHFVCVPSFYASIIEVLKEDDMVSLKTVSLAGEKVKPEVVFLSQKILPELELLNEYGPTENSVSSTLQRNLQNQDVITIGKPNWNTQVYIVDKYLNLMPVGVVGEICLAGEGLAVGYLNRPDLTSEKFVPNPFYPGKKLYRTGDFGRWLKDGRLEFVGREDGQVKIRGFRIEIGEIEKQLLNYPGIKDVVILARPDHSGDLYLCAYLKIDSPEKNSKVVKIEEIRDFLKNSLPLYMIPDYFVVLESFPLTLNGKIDKRSLPEPDTKEFKAEFLPPEGVVEEKVARIWAEVLEIKKVGREDNFFTLGGHSLKAMTLTSRVLKEFGIELPIGEVFESPTLREMSEQIKKALLKKSFLTNENSKTGYPSIPRVEDLEYYPLSSAQKRIYLACQFSPNSTNYNMPGAFFVTGDLNKERFEQTFKALIERHESLRTSFVTRDGEPVQLINSAVEFKVKFSEVNEGELSQVIRDFVKPFSLSQAPLLRAKLFRLNTQQYLCLFDMHHIISDGVSMDIFIRDFINLYSGNKLAGINVRYRDYTNWQKHLLGSKRLKNQEKYWMNKLTELPILDLPTDYPRPQNLDLQGDKFSFILDTYLTKRLKELTVETDTTLYMILLGMYSILLKKYSRQEDIVIGSPIAGRAHPDLEEIIGVFVNMLVIRSKPTGDKAFYKFLQELKEDVLMAYANQDYPYESLVEKLSIERVSNNNLFNTIFALQNMKMSKIEIPGLIFEPYPIKNHQSKFDLSLIIEEKDEELCCELEYNTNLFKEETVRRMSGHLIQVIKRVTEKPHILLKDIEMITEEEKKLLIEEFNQTHKTYPKDRTLAQLFEEQVEIQPDSPALLFKGKTVSYKRLNQLANHLAWKLRSLGIGAEEIVAIMLERSVEMVLAILGVLKAGGAYLPIDPEIPENRKQFMIKDAGVRVLVTKGEIKNNDDGITFVIFDSTVQSESYQDNVENHNIGELKYNIESPDNRIDSKGNLQINRKKIVSFKDTPHEHIKKTFGSIQENPPLINDSRSLAYIIYTSGTTGIPKGVMINQYSVTRTVQNVDYVDIQNRDRVLQLSNYAFDGSVFDIFGALLNGGMLVLVDKETILDMAAIADLIEKAEVSIAFITTALFNALVDNHLASLKGVRKILFGGEKASYKHVKKALEFLGEGRLINVYGPTECTVFTTTHSVEMLDGALEDVPIGRPLANTCCYVFDQEGHLQPIGVPGELWVGGDGLSRGYLNQPELTADKFLKHPFRSDGKLYKTGDLVKWQPDGTLRFISRIDNQIKLRGFRIELSEIENHLVKHPLIEEAKVMVNGEDEFRYLTAYLVSRAELDLADLKKFMKKELPDYMVPTHYVFLKYLPLTPNGKVDEKALLEIKEVVTTDNKKFIPPQHPMEKIISDVWSKVLKVSPIGIGDNFFDLGGHSLNAGQVVSLLHKETGIQIGIKELFQNPTIECLAEVVSSRKGTEYDEISRQEEKEWYELSYAQQRLWYLHQLSPGSIAYNMPGRITLHEPVKANLIEKTLEVLYNRHQSLRTRFVFFEGKVVQKVDSPGEYHLKMIDLSDYDTEERSFLRQEIYQTEITQPFDLEKGSLFRAKLVKISENETDLIYVLHHIISDGWSMNIMRREFFVIYDALKEEKVPDLPEKKIEYTDFAAWQNQLISNRDKFEEVKVFWKDMLLTPGEFPELKLPIDFKGAEDSQAMGAIFKMVIKEKILLELKKQVKEFRISMFTLLITGFSLLLNRLTGQTDLLIGLPVAGREHENLHDLIGFFVNTLVLRTQLDYNERFSQYLNRIQTRILKTLEYQSYPLELVLDELGVEYPEIPVFFNMLNIGEISSGRIAELESSHEMVFQESKFALVLYLTEYENGIEIQCHYPSRLFLPETVEFMMGEYSGILEKISQNPDLTIKEYLSKKKRRKLSL